MNNFKLKLILFIHIINLCKSNKIKTDDNALNYLKKFGYLSNFESRSSPQKLIDKKTLLNEQLNRFQLNHGLKVTGKLDEQTLKKMNSPRCSKPDQFIARRISSFKIATKWSKNSLSYKILNENEELKGKTKKIIADAFKYWSDVSNLTFTEVNPNMKADISIKFGRGNHGDEYPFDGPSGELAHAFFPEEGEIHFDEDETFTLNNKQAGTDLKMVAVHEFGHALGLEHSLAAESIMNPYYKGYEESFKLGKDDIDGIQFLYGKKKNIESKTTVITSTISSKITIKQLSTKTTVRSTTQQQKFPTKIDKSLYLNPCSKSKQSVFLSTDKNILYVLLENDNGLYKFNLKSKEWSKDNLKNIYKELPEKSRGGAVDANGIIYFFHERDLFAYNGSKLLKGYPKTFDDVFYPNHPYAAVFKDNKLYVFKNWLLYEIDLNKLKVASFNTIDYKFPGLGFHVDAALRYNDVIYFFNEKKYYKFDKKTNKVFFGFPKDTIGSWFPC